MAKYQHVRAIDLKKDGVVHEILVIKEDPYNGDIYFIKTGDLDPIDRKRFLNILRRRDASNYPLWDLLSQVTLKNGCNALETYHQLVMNRLVSGKIIPPGKGTGIRTATFAEELGISTQAPAPAPVTNKGRPPTPKE
jgi:hypothetical protein